MCGVNVCVCMWGERIWFAYGVCVCVCVVGVWVV